MGMKMMSFNFSGDIQDGVKEKISENFFFWRKKDKWEWKVEDGVKNLCCRETIITDMVLFNPMVQSALDHHGQI